MILQHIKKPLRWLLLQFESRMAPFIAMHLKWGLLPVYWFLRSKRIVLVWNITGGAGHTIFELDYFFLLKKQNGIRYVWIKKPDGFSEVCMNIYRHHFYKVKSNFFAYCFILPVALAFKDITIDCGLSRLRWHLKADGRYDRPPIGQTYLHQVSKQAGQDLLSAYYKQRAQFLNYYPLLLGKWDESEMDQFLQGVNHPLALIHCKDSIINATACPTDPATYLEAMQWLIKKGFQLVFFGREKMPELFRRLPILNYAESKFATFYNDIVLTKRASLAIAGGSGIAFLPLCLNKPCLYLNSWHISRPLCDPNCMIIPTLVQKKDGRFLSFKEQCALYEHLPDHGAEIFPLDQYEARNASSDEILEGLKELFGLQKKRVSDLQLKYRNLDPTGPLQFAKARCSHYFLEKHQRLFELNFVHFSGPPDSSICPRPFDPGSN